MSRFFDDDVVGSPVECRSLTRCINCTAPPHSNAKPRNLVVCIDGTSNKFGGDNTNVVKLFAKINLGPEDSALPRQRARYFSGLGTRGSFSDLLDMAVAWRVEESVQNAYSWLAKEYKEGDQIYLFGFSRGAYQVRILAGMIYEVGLIKFVIDKQVATAYEHYMAARSGKRDAKDIASVFKQMFCWNNMKVHFVGVWDTVSSVGLVKEDVFLSISSSAEHACHLRHALALDERRVKFMPEYFHEMNTTTDDRKVDNAQKQNTKRIFEELGVVVEEQLTATDNEKPTATADEKSQAKRADGTSRVSKACDLKEVWFAGSHSDVGGANLPGKSFHAGNISLMWMRQEAAECGLILKPTDRVWTPADLERGTSNSMSLTWNLIEFLPIKHQVSWWGPGGHVRKLHLSKHRRIIPGQKIHASVLFSNTYRPEAHLGGGFVFPTGWPSTSGNELDDEKWEKVHFDYTAVRELFRRLQSSGRAPLRYLDSLVFSLRFEEGRNCVRGEDKWQETFQNIIYGNSESIVKLVAIVAYYEASFDDAINEVTVSKDVAKETTPSKDKEVTSSKHVVNRVTLSEDVLKDARRCLQDILSRRSDRHCRRVTALLRPMTDHEALRKEILTAEVIKTFIGLLDQVLRIPGPDFGPTMDALGCLLKHQDLKIPLFEGSRPVLMLAGRDRSRLTASLHVILPFARTERGRIDCEYLRPMLRHLARNHQGRVGSLAVETLLELDESEKANTEAGQRALAERLHNDNFRANLAHVFYLSGTDDQHLSRNRDDHASSDALRRFFGLGDDGQRLRPTQKMLIRHLQSATADREEPGCTAATFTVLKLCEDSRLRTYLLGEDITGAFIKQLKRRDTSLLGAHALTTCLQYEDMKPSILSNEEVLKYIVEMLRLDSFDDAVGPVEGWQVFAKLMGRLMQDGLKQKIGGEDSEITKVLEEKLRSGKPKDIRTSLVSLGMLRSLGQDFWTNGLVGKGVAHLKSKEWKTQKAGITILSALAQTAHGVNAIEPHIKDIVNMLLPDPLQPTENLTVGPRLKPACMLGPACALRVLSEDETLCKKINEMPEVESLKDLWLDGNLIEHDTPRWQVKSPTRDDVLKMVGKMIGSLNGDLSADVRVTSDGRLALPEIQHWDRLAGLVRDSVVKVVVFPARFTAEAYRHTSQQLSSRQMVYLLGRLLQHRRSQPTGQC